MLCQVLRPDDGRLTGPQHRAGALPPVVRPVPATVHERELTGTTDKLDAFLEALDRSAILETVRTILGGAGLEVTTLTDPREFWDTLETVRPNRIRSGGSLPQRDCQIAPVPPTAPTDRDSG